MLKTTKVKPTKEDLGLVNENSTINGVGSGNKISRTKSQMDFWSKLSMFKNKIRPDLAKSQLLVELSSGLEFLTTIAKLTFAKLR